MWTALVSQYLLYLRPSGVCMHGGDFVMVLNTRPFSVNMWLYRGKLLPSPLILKYRIDIKTSMTTCISMFDFSFYYFAADVYTRALPGMHTHHSALDVESVSLCRHHPLQPLPPLYPRPS